MATTGERIKNMANASSNLTGSTKQEQEAGRQYLIEKHAREAKRAIARTFGGVMVDTEAEAAAHAEAAKKKRERDSEVSDLAAEQQRADEEAAGREAKRILTLQAQQAKAKQDAKPKRTTGLLVVKKAIATDTGPPAEGAVSEVASVNAENGAEPQGSSTTEKCAGTSAEATAPVGTVAGTSAETTAPAGTGIGLGGYGSSSSSEEET
eukprot:TRINITY_DN80414_c0_g1_i1.p1 TRINITY_DN80414_c0_g1~~TRINITY_DN80414_c0_g1_i1.p1  ORF type:complete len:208 (-),score=55.76 TRINITY_DN80414_c0_g1_i1:120-743(-)